MGTLSGVDRVLNILTGRSSGMESENEVTASNLLGVTDEQAKAVKALAELGTTVVAEGGQLARYMGRVLGTAPEDAVGLVLGDPLHFVRTVIARTLANWSARFSKGAVLQTRSLSVRHWQFHYFVPPTMKAAPSFSNFGRN
jgi:hypothetical protein